SDSPRSALIPVHLMSRQGQQNLPGPTLRPRPPPILPGQGRARGFRPPGLDIWRHIPSATGARPGGIFSGMIPQVLQPDYAVFRARPCEPTLYSESPFAFALLFLLLPAPSEKPGTTRAIGWK